MCSLMGIMKRTTESFFQVLKATKNVITTLAVKHPAFFVAFLMLAGWFIFALGRTETTMVAMLCVVITVVSIITFIKTRDFGQTSLTFVIGLFTVFSVTWNRELWVSFYVGFNLFVLIISSTGIAAEVQSILTQDASFSGKPDFNRVYRKLDCIVRGRADHQPGVVERSQIVRFLCFRKAPTADIELLLPQIETV